MGDSVGLEVGRRDGPSVTGDREGFMEGESVGLLVGLDVGSSVGLCIGEDDGLQVGLLVGWLA